MFRLGWSRFLPFIGYHHVLMALIVSAAIFICIILAGCTSEGLKDVYLLSLSYGTFDASKASTNVSAALASLVGNSTSLEVRVGFMGLCAHLPSGAWSCSSSVDTVASSVNYVAPGQNASATSQDALDLVNIARSFKSEVVFEGLYFIALFFSVVAFGILWTFPGWAREEDSEGGSDRDVKPFPSRILSQAATASLLVSALMTLLSVFWQHLASAGAATMSQVLTSGTIVGQVGSVTMGLGWAAVFIHISVFLGMLLMILSIRVLEQLVD